MNVGSGWFLVLGILVTGLASGCKSHWAEKTANFSGDCWQIGDTITVDFENKDTARVFQLQFPLTITENYPFNNIYLRGLLRAPSGDVSVLPSEFRLTSEDGTWLGEISGEKIRFQLKLAEGIRFSQTGHYQLSLFHYMRDDSLCGVVAAGIAIDPVEG